MKWLLAGLALVWSSFTGKAQKVYLGAEAGINTSSMAIQQEGRKLGAGMVQGYRAGAIADIRFNDMFSIQPGLFYTTKGYNDQRSNSNQFTHYIEVPANLQFRFPAGPGHFFTGGGPYMAYLTKATATDPANRQTSDIAVSDLKPLDIGLNLNAGYLLRGNWYLRTNAGFGFANLKPNGNTDNSLRNFSLGFTLGYLFSK